MYIDKERERERERQGEWEYHLYSILASTRGLYKAKMVKNGRITEKVRKRQLKRDKVKMQKVRFGSKILDMQKTVKLKVKFDHHRLCDLIIRQLKVWAEHFFYFPPSSGIASCVRTVWAVMCLSGLVQPC